MAAVNICSDFRAQGKEICHYLCIFPFCLPRSNGAKCYDLSFSFFFFFCLLYWILSQFFHSSPSFSSRDSLVSLCFLPLECYHLHTWHCWCYSCLSWFQLITHPPWHFSWCAQHINKQGDSRQFCCTPFSILNQSFVSYRVLTVASWTTNRFLMKHIRWFSIPISLRAFHNVVIYTLRGFSVVGKTEVDAFSGIPLLSLWSSESWKFDLGSSSFSKLNSHWPNHPGSQ